MRTIRFPMTRTITESAPELRLRLREFNSTSHVAAQRISVSNPFVHRIAIFLLLCCASHALSAPRPNIVLIMADDMGFSDVGCYGGEIQTPNIDRLASRGVRFTQFYNNTRCCPTRASLLTGMYPHQVGVGAMNQNLGSSAYRGELSESSVTLAEALRSEKYRTGMAGKWHLSNLNVSPTALNKPLLNFEVPGEISASKKSWPVNRGFEQHFGTIAGVGSFFDPWSLVHNETVIRPEKNFYYTDFISERACALIDEFSPGAKAPGLAVAESAPFFLYVAYTAPHWPMQARPADIAKYKGAYVNGWDEIRAKRYERLVQMGIIDRKHALSPTTRPWKDAQHKEWEAHRMAVYAAMIDSMDQGIGKILDKLEQRGLTENTLVMFLSDNGGCAENVLPHWYDIPSKTRDGREIRIGNDPNISPGDETTFQSYGPAWAAASNTPFRKFKHYIEEGGIATPFIVRWPAAIKREGQLERQVGHVIDIVPTCLNAAGAEIPEVEGMSLLPWFNGAEPKKDRRLFWEHEGARGVRDGDWKLTAAKGEEWHLYNVADDRTELNDLAAKKPEKLAELTALYDSWAKHCGVQPWPIKK
jgi:arylsulfatase